MTALQLALLAGMFYLDDLSRKRMGVNRHVAYRKRQYLQTVLDADHRMVYGFVAGLLLTVLVFHMIRHRGDQQWKTWLPLTGMTLVLGLILTLPAALQRPAYVYLLAGAGVIWLLEGIKVLYPQVIRAWGHKKN